MAESVSFPLGQSRKRSRAELDAEIRRMADEQGVKPFDFDEVFGMGRDAISDEELEDFLEYRRQVRRADREAQEKQWQS